MCFAGVVTVESPSQSQPVSETAHIALRVSNDYGNNCGRVTQSEEQFQSDRDQNRLRFCSDEHKKNDGQQKNLPSAVVHLFDLE